MDSNIGPSEGELFLQEFFYSEGIYFESEVRIDNLQNDTKGYRIADFYLPRYKTYVEFCGRWNLNENDQNKYREKMRVYDTNNIPCIFIFPENLGIIHYSFRHRMRHVLKKYSLQKELYLFNKDLFTQERSGSILAFIFFLLLLILFQFDRDAEWFWESCLFVGGLVIYYGYKIISGYKKFFVKENSYVNFTQERD